MIRWSFIIGLLLSLPATASAQASLAAGAAFPAGPEGFRQTYSPGLGLSGSFALPIGLPVSPRLVAGFDVLPVDDEVLRRIGQEVGARVDGGDLTAIFVGLDVPIMASTRFARPYISPIGGISFISISELEGDDVPFQAVESESAFTLGATLGVVYPLSGTVHFMLEGRVLHAFTEGENITWIPIHAGVFFDL